MLFIKVLVPLCLGFAFSLAACSRVKTPELISEDEHYFGPDERGTPMHRQIRAYLECKGLKCEERYPEAKEAVEARSEEFKDVWNTLALDDEGNPKAEYAQRLKSGKKNPN